MPEQFGHYVLEGLLGRGGMGEVYRAYDTKRDRVVALKRLPKEMANDETFQARFRRECRLVARLNEPHVIPIHDFGEIEGHLYLDMRLVEGVDLSAVIAEDGPLDPKLAVDIIGQIASALQSAHDSGLVHRDIKPSNILLTGLTEDRQSVFAYLVDFGIARTEAGGGTALTATTGTVGTLGYMAPERISGADGDHRSDIYSLACVLYETLTGHAPYKGETFQVMFAHVNAAPPMPSAERRDIPRALDDVIRTGLAKDPAARFQTAHEFAAAGRAALADSGVTPPLPPSAAAPPGQAPNLTPPPRSAPPPFIPRPAPQGPPSGPQAPPSQAPSSPIPTSGGQTPPPFRQQPAAARQTPPPGGQRPPSGPVGGPSFNGPVGNSPPSGPVGNQPPPSGPVGNRPPSGPVGNRPPSGPVGNRPPSGPVGPPPMSRLDANAKPIKIGVTAVVIIAIIAVIVVVLVHGSGDSAQAGPSNGPTTSTSTHDFPSTDSTAPTYRWSDYSDFTQLVGDSSGDTAGSFMNASCELGAPDTSIAGMLDQITCTNLKGSEVDFYVERFSSASSVSEYGALLRSQRKYATSYWTIGGERRGHLYRSPSTASYADVTSTVCALPTFVVKFYAPAGVSEDTVFEDYWKESVFPNTTPAICT